MNLNTDFRKVAKNDFENDYLKLINYTVLGKCMLNITERMEIKTVFDENHVNIS